jgi:hypothetical protein
MLPGRTKAEGDAIRLAEARDAERAAILAELDALDRRSARAIRAVVAGTATDDDKAALAKIEHEAIALRARLAELDFSNNVRLSFPVAGGAVTASIL